MFTPKAPVELSIGQQAVINEMASLLALINAIMQSSDQVGLCSEIAQTFEHAVAQGLLAPEYIEVIKKRASHIFAPLAQTA